MPKLGGRAKKNFRRYAPISSPQTWLDGYAPGSTGLKNTQKNAYPLKPKFSMRYQNVSR